LLSKRFLMVFERILTTCRTGLLGAAVLASGGVGWPQPAGDALALPADDAAIPGAGPVNRKDWFAPHWRELRMKWHQERDHDRHAVVFLGDSITEAWTDLARAFPDIKVANRGSLLASSCSSVPTT